MRTLFNLVAGAFFLMVFGSIAVVGCTAMMMPKVDPAVAAASRQEMEARQAKDAEQRRIDDSIAAEEQAAREAEDAARPQMNLANYNRCQPGMTKSEVFAIVGQPDGELSSSEIAGISTVMYEWKAGFVANANMMFQDGKLIQKAKFGF